jgi:hypothetical protein
VVYSVVHSLLLLLQAMYNTVNHTGSRLARKTCTTISKLIYRPDDDPVRDRNTVAKTKYIYTW